MNQKLKLSEISQNSSISESWKTQELFISDLLKIDIVMIDTVEFCWNIKKKKHETFVSSFYKIDQIIEDRVLTFEVSKKEELENMKKKIFEQYHDWLDVFFKQILNELVSHWFYDHKIELFVKNNLSFSFLYKYSAEKLLIIKKYITENLHKNFIMFSQTFFITSILFVRKINKNFWFCVNYYKLNIIIKKNNYLLLLINEILKRLDHARIFIKLNIWQIFHYVWIEFDLENLITFQIRYEIYKYRMLFFDLINEFIIF